MNIYVKKELCHSSRRGISDEFAAFLPLFDKLDELLKTQSVMLAVDGGSAGGKSTLGALLQSVYGCAVFHMDDFFLRPEQRTPERYAELGGNVDRERFLTEVLQPLKKGGAVTYRPFDCVKFALGEPITVKTGRLTVVEGVYSMHPELAPYYDLSVFLDITEELQRARIEKRESPQLARRFFEEWIPLENLYFEGMRIKEKCDLTVDIR